jgi:hypothetical protein
MTSYIIIPAQGELVSDIPAGDGNIEKFFAVYWLTNPETLSLLTGFLCLFQNCDIPRKVKFAPLDNF